MKLRMSHTLALVALAALAACSQKPAATTGAAKPDNVAQVDGKNISRNTFNQYVKGVAGKPAEDLTPEQRTELLDNLVRAQVIADESEKNGLAARDETRAVLDLSRLSILQQAASQEYLKDRKPSDEELRAEYDIQVGSMDRLQFRASHILVRAEDQAKEIIARVKGGGDFAKLARELSTDTGSREKGGDLDWFSPGSMTPPFADAVRKLKKGETTDAPVKTEFGWHVIRVTDTRDVQPPPFESVKDRLVQIVEGKKFKAHVDGLLAKAKVTKTL
jgi:peptidyl-prolyl cis-trans isomerase C